MKFFPVLVLFFAADAIGKWSIFIMKTVNCILLVLTGTKKKVKLKK